ncbi:MAG: NADH:ubiquinone reductase (Na(+)-transporting) subunit C [Candidatus Cryptobacteroides sp.]
MNTNGNTYTVIYSTVLVMVVAAVLAFAAISLKPRQDENVKKETITKVLIAATESSNEMNVSGDTDVMAMYAAQVRSAFYVDGNGNEAGLMETGKDDIKKIEVATTSDLKRQNDIIKQIDKGNTDLLASLRLPVYIFDIDGESVTVIPCYGAGLWGPIWGYIAVKEDGRDILGAIFDHKSETPGLGAKIAEEPFYTQFIGKRFSDSEPMFSVVKGGAKGAADGVDAVSGATITSRALGVTINTWVKYYEPYFTRIRQAAEAAEVSGASEMAEAAEAAQDSAETSEAEAVK